MSGQRDFWDVEERYALLSKAGDPLEWLDFRQCFASGAIKGDDGRFWMMRRFVSVGAVLVMLFGLTGCSGGYEWHQRLTVTVETPEGVVSGSAVTSIEWTDNFFSGSWGGAAKHQKTIGEAVTVDLGNGRYLFALLGGEATANLATQLVMDTTKRAWSDKAFEGVHKLPRPTTIPSKLYPLLVTFDDINDPASVKKVAPNDLAATFGSGYALNSITLEITDEPVTEGKVEAVLGWLGDWKGRIKRTDKKYADELTIEEQLYRLNFTKD